MDYKEEQLQELEILESIYPDELTKLSDTEFTINLKLDVESENQHNLLLHVKYPETYPEQAPDLDITVAEGEYDDESEEESDDDEDKPKGPVIIADIVQFDANDLQKLLNKLIEECELNIGIPIVFTILSILKDNAEQLFIEKVKYEQDIYDKELIAKELKEQQKFIGTRVTPESFKQWRAKFREEQHIEEKYRLRFVEIHQGKMTGKELFVKGLAKGIEDDELIEKIDELTV